MRDPRTHSGSEDLSLKETLTGYPVGPTAHFQRCFAQTD